MKDDELPIEIQEQILKTLGRPGAAWWGAFTVCSALSVMAMAAWGYQIEHGLGVSGLTVPVMWGAYITTFVYFIGVSHSGTLISAILYLTRSPLRAALGRSAEAMTVIAIITAGVFPIIHLGRAWIFFWLIPYPNQRELWVNFRSPLIWDLCAILSYMTTSVLFLYVGMLPDLALLGRRIKGWRGAAYRALSLGFGGSDREWVMFDKAYPIFAALVIPLAVSVHSVVSWDFAMTLLPGWHSTVFAPYFVAGAIFSGLAMAITLLALLRRGFHLERWICIEHFELMAKLMVTMSLVMTLVYATELFFALFKGEPVERDLYLWRLTGPYAGVFWGVIFCNSIVPLLIFWRRVRRSIPALFAISLLVNVGMWLERFIIVVTATAHSFEPANWRLYTPSWTEAMICGGFLGVFGLLFLLFTKLMPSVSMAETMQGLLPDGHGEIGETTEAPAGAGWVMGMFERSKVAAAAVAQLRSRGRLDARVQTLAPCAAAMQTGGWSWQRALPWLALSGGLIGLACAVGLEAGTSLAQPMIVGGKPVLSWPAFAVVFFEFTMLGAGLATFLTTVFFCARGRRGLPRGARDQIARGRIVVAVPTGSAGVAEVTALLGELGADEVCSEGGSR